MILSILAGVFMFILFILGIYVIFALDSQGLLTKYWLRKNPSIITDELIKQYRYKEFLIVEKILLVLLILIVIVFSLKGNLNNILPLLLGIGFIMVAFQSVKNRLK